MARFTRRKFLQASGAGLAGVLASHQAPVFAQQSQVHWIKWNDFVPASDELLRKSMLPEAMKALGVKINLETVNGNDLQPRVTSAIQSGTGPDVFMLFNNHPQIYGSSAADVSDVADAIAKAQGGYYNVATANTKDGKKTLSVPWAVIGAMTAYRKSWFEEVGYSKFPETWQEYHDAGKKAKGRPLGQTLGHTFGDAPTFSYPYLWSWGGKEVDEKGKVVLNSKETLESVKFMQAFWKDSFDEGGLAWDDTNNNRAFLSGTVSATLNGASIYIESLRKPDQYQTEKGGPMKDDIRHSPLPKGPKGQFGFHLFQSHMVMSYSKNQKAAKEFLKWIHTPANYEKWFLSQKGYSTPPTAQWEKHKMWDADPVMAPFKIAARLGLSPGYAGRGSGEVGGRRGEQGLHRYLGLCPPQRAAGYSSAKTRSRSGC